MNEPNSKIIDVTDLTNSFSSNSLRIPSNDLSSNIISISQSQEPESPNELTPNSQFEMPKTGSKLKRTKSLKDSDFISYFERPQLPGESEIEISCSNGDYPPIKVNLPNHWLQFQLKPTYIGSPKNHFFYLNAQDPQFYYMRFDKPKLTIWLLIRNTTFINTGYVKRRIVEECIRRQWNCHLVNPNKFDLNLSNISSSNVNHDNEYNNRMCSYNGQLIPFPDIVIPRVGANVDYFGLSVLRQLESFGVCILNPAASIEISRDKLYTHQILSQIGKLPIPKSILSKWPFDLNYIEKSIQNYPMIVKLLSSSKGEAVWKVDNREELIDLVNNKLDTKKPIIFQQFLKNSKGRDIRCFVIGDQVIASMMRIAPTGEYKANVHRGGSVKYINAGSDLTELCLLTTKLCGLHISGVDVLLDGENGYKICEVNSSPGFQGLEKATSVDVAKIMLNFALNEFERTKSEREKKYQSNRTEQMKQWNVPIQKNHLHLIADT